VFAAVVIFPPTPRSSKFSQHPTSIWLHEKKDDQNRFILVKKKRKHKKKKTKWNHGVLVVVFVVCFRMLVGDAIKRVDYNFNTI
jgi:hypothetical protein